jgi:hypothetical protein
MVEDYHDHQNATFITSMPLKYPLSAIPEALVITIFIVVGFLSRHISKLGKGSIYTVVEVMKPAHNPHVDRISLTHMAAQTDGRYEPYKTQYPSQIVQNPEYWTLMNFESGLSLVGRARALSRFRIDR